MRTIGFEAIARHNPIGRSKQHLQTKIGHEGKPDDVGFHLLADVLGGPINRLNVVPGYKMLNESDYKDFEMNINNLAKEYGEIEVQIKLKYLPGNTSTRPDSFVYKYFDPSERDWIDRKFPNL